ncbi:MAG TPA: SDR family NAD(P)-dependent oxidoreductase [Acidimicrobiales bacterium]|nr:SDR family NAD(P)-dependent oxidoreductase [Acidimicrobiales bacterium]
MPTPQGKIAVVTGGGSGIGWAISARLAADGHAVAVLDVDEPAARNAADKIAAGGAEAVGLAVDVGDRAQVMAAVEHVRRQLGPVGILVNNAGTGAVFTRFLKVTPEEWSRVFEVNLAGAFHCCQAVLPDMIDAGWGRIVNISSSSTHGGQALLGPYVSSKSGLNGLTKSLALEFGPKGVTVNAIPPGFIDTPMLRASEARGEFGPGGVDDAIGRTPVRRAGLPDDIAATCSFLCREEAGYITGQIIGVNGGRNT